MIRIFPDRWPAGAATNHRLHVDNGRAHGTICWTWRGITLLELERWDDGAEDLGKAVAMGQDEGWILAWYGNALKPHSRSTRNNSVMVW